MSFHVGASGGPDGLHPGNLRSLVAHGSVAAGSPLHPSVACFFLLQPDNLFGDEGFAAETDIQQGDPIGPALFALSVDKAALGVQSEFNAWYLDGATLGDSPERVHDDLVVLLEKFRAIGLEVNESKCEIAILIDSMPEATEALFRRLLPRN